MGKIQTKPFLTISKQIERLKSLGVTFENESDAELLLSKNSYFSVINGYKEPFLFLGQKDKFKRGTTFTEIHALYNFDAHLRNALFSEILIIENTLKSEIIYEFLLSIDGPETPGDSYLQISSYNISQKDGSSVNNLIKNLNEIISKNLRASPSVAHYHTKYGYIPLWVLVTHMTFGQISKFYKHLKPGVRQAISKKYHLTDKDLETFLKILSKTRNHCAHSNRLYCSKFLSIPKTSEKTYPIQAHFLSNTSNKETFLNILITLKYFINQKGYRSLINKINTLFKELEHKLSSITVSEVKQQMGIPSDWLDLGKKT